MCIRDRDYPDFEPVLNFNFAGSSTQLDPRLLYRRSGVASFVDANGLVKIVGENTPRFDHDPISRKNKGVLIEHSRANQMIYSSDITGSTVYNGTVTGDATTAPDGTTTADQFAANSSNAMHRIDVAFTSGQISNSTAYSFSVFIKANGYDKLHIRYAGYNSDNHGLGYDLSDGTTFAGKFDGTSSLGAVTSSSMIAYPNGWYKCSFTFTTASDAATGTSQILYYVSNSESTTNFAGDGSSGMYFWGAQFEVGAYPSSYIPTYGRTRTRGADLLLIDGDDSTALSDAYNDQEGTLVVEYHNVTTDGTYVATIDDGSNKNRYAITNSKRSQGISVSGGSSQGQLDNGTPIVGATNKMAHAYKLNDRGLSLNGNDATQDNGFALPTGIRFIWIGCRAGSYDFLGSTISRFMYYTKRLPNSQLKLLTSQ